VIQKTDIKQPSFVYDNLIQEGLNHKGKGHLIKVAIKGFKEYYGKEISTKYLKQFINNFSYINQLEQEKKKLKLKVVLCDGLSKEFVYRDKIEEINKKLKPLKAGNSRKISNLIYNYKLKTKRLNRYFETNNFSKSYVETNYYNKDKTGKAYLEGIKNIVVGHEFKGIGKEVLFIIQ